MIRWRLFSLRKSRFAFIFKVKFFHENPASLFPAYYSYKFQFWIHSFRKFSSSLEFYAKRGKSSLPIQFQSTFPAPPFILFAFGVISFFSPFLLQLIFSSEKVVN
jgi:hypothetical protein